MSDYLYHIRKIKEQLFIMIEDRDLGNCSVTNNIEAVVEAVCKKYNINPVHYNIIYMDSQGNWDGYIFATKTFYPIQEKHWLRAAIKVVNKQST